jgi:ketosteroid isomerase-like protein
VDVEPAQERLIRDLYAAFVRGDLEEALGTFAPESTYTNPDYAIEGGVRSGREEILAGFKALHDGFEYSTIEIDEIVEGPNGVLVIVHIVARGKESGAPLDTRFAHVFRMRGKQVVDFAWFASVHEGREAAGV